jgi:crossover junction endodeoxyribonuclease RuvC
LIVKVSLKVLGIDPGLRVTGWAVLRCVGSVQEVLASGVIKPSVEGHLSARLQELHHQVAAVYELHQPDRVGAEEGYCGVDGRSALKLGMVRGAILTACPKLVYMYPPAYIKKAVCGLGNASKDVILEVVNEKFPDIKLKNAQHDIADAIAIGLCAAQEQGDVVPG